MGNRIKIKTIYGKILTIDVDEETETHIIGKGKFKEFIKIKKSEIEDSTPVPGDKKWLLKELQLLQSE